MNKDNEKESRDNAEESNAVNSTTHPSLGSALDEHSESALSDCCCLILQAIRDNRFHYGRSR